MSFSESYLEARHKFRLQAQQVKAELIEVPICETAEHGSLSIDIATIGRGRPRALVICSGVHGIEGFAGSAIQIDFLTRKIPNDLAVVLIHAVNPFGMATGRRVNENNVDLNRNVLPDGAHYAGASPGYRKLDSFLNPRTPYHSRDSFLLRALLEIGKRGMPAVRQSVASGQYEFPKGLFFGGMGLELGPEKLLGLFPQLLGAMERQVIIDIHTGLGRRGRYLLVSSSSRLGELAYCDKTASSLSLLDKGKSIGYTPSGALIPALEQQLGTGAESVMQEFGTQNSLAVLRALRAENRANFWGGEVDKAKAALREAFYPQSEHWRRAVLRGGRELIDRVIEYLRAGA